MPKSNYDDIAEEYYDSGHITSRNFDHTTIEALQSHPFQIPSDGLILELGAGRGRAIEYLGVPPTRLVQLDNSERMLNLADREPCLLRIFADACKIPLVSQQFTAIVGFLVDPFLGLNCLTEAYRMLQNGGSLLLTTPTFEWGSILRKKIEIEMMTTRFRVLGTEKIVVLPSLLHSKDKIFQMLDCVGFKEIKILEHCLPRGEDPISEDIRSVREEKGVAYTSLPILHSIRAIRP